MKFKRLQALFLAMLMIFYMTLNTLPAYAGLFSAYAARCTHHTEHIGCSYSEGSEGSPCNHKHNDLCGYQEAKDEIQCDKECVDKDNDGKIDHVEDCAYQPAVEGQECTHRHDAACGYEESVESVPCDFVCSICDCTCTSLCKEGSVNVNCPVCGKDSANCTFTTVEASMSFNTDYQVYGEEGDAMLAIAGNITGKKITKADVSVTLTDEEAAMLDISGIADVSLKGNKLVFTIVNDENSGEVSVNYSIPVQAESLSIFDIGTEDIDITVSPKEYQSSDLVDINLAGDKIIFVEKLPINGEYGSGTTYEAQVEDVTVRYVDREGKPAPRQEVAPTFTLYYQVSGDEPTAVQEGNLPFGIQQIPKIKTKAGESAWIGQIADSSSLPSVVLAMQDGKYVEKEVTWFMIPSYPNDYFENAGKIVKITDENANNYPSGLGRGWYFIGGMEPFPDDVVTVKEYVPSLKHDIYWADNANADRKRPTDVDGLYELQYAMDGSSDYKTLTEENISKLGLTSIPQPVKTTQGGIWQVDWRNSLPSKVSFSDSTGSGNSLIRDVSWRIVFKSAPAGYALVEVTPENAGDYPSAKDQYGTYYVLETSLTFNARIYQGNSENISIEDIREAFLQQFYLDAEYTGNKHQYFQLASIRDDGHYSPVENPNDPSLIAVTVTNLWRYNLDNTRINYSVREGKPEDNVDYRLTGVSGLDEGDYFSVSYDNSSVPSFSNKVDSVYSGGMLKLTLTGIIEYHATKVWLDDGKVDRPTAIMELWRYRSGQPYSTASLVRDANGEHYVVNLDTISPNADGHYNIDFVDNLPKYDPEGYRYRYVVREYLSGTNADSYEQVFGTVAQDGTVTDTLPEYSPRNENDTFLYNGGILSNRLKGFVPVLVTKDWKAASFQSEFDDVMVELRLQSRMKGKNAEWEDTEYTYKMSGFLAENLTVTHTENYPQYDMLGRELEYRWIEEAVWQGGTIENGSYIGGEKVPSSLNDDGSSTFTLEQNGRKIIYTSRCNSSGDGEKENCTFITNSIANVINYEVKKEFVSEWNANDYADIYTFSLFRATSGSDLERYATFTIDKDTENDPPQIIKHMDDGASISIEQTEEWHVIIHGLPEFDGDGQQYEYLLMEVDGSFTNIKTELDDNWNYKSVITNNSSGSGNSILVRKAWVDESDSQHRLPVEITVYDKVTNESIGEPVVLGTHTWYTVVNIGNKNPDEVYILETKVGDKEIENPVDGSGNPIPPIYTGTSAGTAVQFSTQYHNYEATYSYDENFGATSGSEAYKGMHCYTVTNRRLGSINMTVTKNWVDGNGDKRIQLQQALESAGLNLAVKLEFMSQPSLGMEQIYNITTAGYGNANQGDTVTISQGNPTAIKDNNGNQVDSIQLFDMGQSEQILYFWNLPKYDGNGASVRYTVKEIFVDSSGNEVRDLNNPAYDDVAKIWKEYKQNLAVGPYVVGENHALDTQEFYLTNKLNSTTSVSWYTLWLDDFAYKENSRPDIYLNIYARYHNEDGTTYTRLVIRNYRWEFKEYDEDPEITHQNFWKCTIENLPKYDAFGYEIEYFAMMDSVVVTGDFDYLPTAYAPGESTNDNDIFATSNGLNGDATYENLIVNVSQDPGTVNYALMSGNTFINRIYDTITFSGEKLWTNLPDGYPIVDLPSVTFNLSRSKEDGKTDTDIATMTIKGSDWQNLNINGHYIFAFGHTGENKPVSSFDENNVPSGTTLLPRFDSKGRLYTYTLKEEINWENTDAGNDGRTDGIFDVSSSGQTFDNSYRLTGTAQLSAKKYLKVKSGLEVYPAIKFNLARVYTTNGGALSEAETVMTTTWMADEVKAAVESQTASSGDVVTVEKILTFNDLPVYAPNGSKYIYTITEDKSQLGGFNTWAAQGDVTAQDIKSDSNIVDFVTNLWADTNPDIDATFLNEAETNPDSILLTGGKKWNDLNNDLRPNDPTLGLSVTLKRRADAQVGQNNSIGWQNVDIIGKITWEQDSENADRWNYTITDMERYAPNGMPWIYQITEKPVQYYTASNNGVAGQKSQDDVSGNIIMNDLVNSMLTSTYFKKTWVDSNGKDITENLLGDGIELEVRYELQLRAQSQTDGTEWSEWQLADEYFNDHQTLGTRTYNGVIRAALGDSAWNMSYRGNDDSFNNLPKYVMDSANEVYALEYRVVETEVKVYRNGQNEPLLVQAYTAPRDNGDNQYAYGAGSNNTLFVPYYGAGKNTQSNNTVHHKNQMHTTGITVAKEWRNDNNDVYITRPKSTVSRYDWEVTLVIQRSIGNGEPYPVETVTLYGTNSENEKRLTIDGLPQFLFDANGELQRCTYYIQELQSKETTVAGERKPLNEGEIFNGSYTVNYSSDRLTAVNTLNSTEFYAEKVWNDEEQTHPNITLELKYLKDGGNPDNPGDYKSFETAAQVQLGAGEAETNPGDKLYYAKEDWIAVWKNVPQRIIGSELDDTTGNTIYKIFETVTGDYIIDSKTEGNTTIITNTPIVTPTVTKHWLGVLEANEITVVLYRNTVQNTTPETVSTKTLTVGENWSHTFESQPKYDSNGNAYKYWVEESQIDGQKATDVAKDGGYEISYGGSVESGFHIYNHKLDTVYVIKDWADVSDSEHRPNDLQLTLQRTTKTNPTETDWETVTDVQYTWEKNGAKWNTSFTDLPQYDIESEQIYTYRVLETVPGGYKQEIINSDSNTFHFKNVRSELVDIPVQKVWIDNGNQLGYRPDMIIVELYANNNPTGERLELKPGALHSLWNSLTGSYTGWKGIFEDQPKYDDTGKLIEYSVVEVSVPDHYKVSYSKEQDGTQVITNTANGNLTITKNVNGSGGFDEEFNFVVQLSDSTINGTYGEVRFKDGVAEFTLSHGQTKIITDLPANVTYTVTEKEANMGAYTTKSSKEKGEIMPGDTVNVAFTNHLSRISIPVSKIWQDNNNQHGIRPNEITVKLLANGENTDKILVLNETNNWKGSFTDLDEFSDGKKIVYTVEEVSVDKYTTKISGDAESGYIITNVYMHDAYTPKSGDNSNIMFWIALLFISGGLLGVAIYFTKRK